jgi:hypothetical protein
LFADHPVTTTVTPPFVRVKEFPNPVESGTPVVKLNEAAPALDATRARAITESRIRFIDILPNPRGI